MLNCFMRALSIPLFLFIFLPGCFDKEEINLGNDAELAQGQPVANEDFCQRLGVVDPVQVRKHELPLPLQGFRDHCQSLVKERPLEFESSDPFYRCIFTWQQNSPEVNNDIQGFLDSSEGDGFTEMLKQEGDLDLSLSSQTILFAARPDDRGELFWKKDQLWQALTSTVPDLESLSWRLAFQYQNSVVCSAFAKWQRTADQMFLHNVEKCDSEGQHFNETYTFGLAGELIQVEKEPALDPSSTCPSF